MYVCTCLTTRKYTCTCEAIYFTKGKLTPSKFRTLEESERRRISHPLNNIKKGCTTSKERRGHGAVHVCH